MQSVADRSKAPNAIRNDLGAIFISLELSRSTWLITSLSPGAGERMSKHAVRAGDIAGLLDRFAQFREKTQVRMGGGLAIRRHPGGRVCAIVKAPSPEEEDRRRVCRERKVLISERIRHVNRVKGLLCSQGISSYEPLRRDRRGRLDTLQTGDGRPLPSHLKAQILRELDRLELLLDQIKAVEAERDVLCGAQQIAAPAPAAMLLDIKGIGPEFATILWSERAGYFFTTSNPFAWLASPHNTPSASKTQNTGNRSTCNSVS
jgi:transposase